MPLLYPRRVSVTYRSRVAATALLLSAALLITTGCIGPITVSPKFQPLPALAALPLPALELDEHGFLYCYRDEPCEVDDEMGHRYQVLFDEFFPPQGSSDPGLFSPVRVVTEMRLVNDYQGRQFTYGLFFGPLSLIAPIPYPMALDFLTLSTVMNDKGQPIRVYRSRQSLEFWTYSAWGLRDPQLTEAAMRHHLRALTRKLQFDASLFQPVPPSDAQSEPVETPVGSTPDAPSTETSG